MFNANASHRIWYCLLLSLVFHLLFLSLAPMLPKSEAPLPLLELNPPPFAVQTLNRKELKKFRQVGIKDGAKEFSMPWQQSEDISRLSLDKAYQIKSLGPSKQRMLHSEALEQAWAASGTSVGKVLGRTGINIDFRLPEGVKEDELNSAEKIFWTFKKRTYLSYVSAFVKSYNQFVLERPSIKQLFLHQRDFVSGKITFDQNGNIVRIKITHPPSSDDLFDLFEKTLVQIHKLPNPPKAILENDRFVVYYQLRIN